MKIAFRITVRSYSTNVVTDDPGVRLESGGQLLASVSRTTRPERWQSSSHGPRRLARARAEARHEQTLQELFAADRDRFVRVAYGILKNKEDAEDAVQDAFVSACRYLWGFEGRSALKTWLTRIVMNAALMMRRKRKNITVAFISEFSGDDLLGSDRIPDVQPNPEQAYSRAESHELLKALLDHMNPLLREALTMTYYHELTTAEASSVLGIPLGTYKARVFRARRLLEERASKLAQAPARSPSLGSTPNRSFAPQPACGTGALTRKLLDAV